MPGLLHNINRSCEYISICMRAYSWVDREITHAHVQNKTRDSKMASNIAETSGAHKITF